MSSVEIGTVLGWVCVAGIVLLGLSFVGLVAVVFWLLID